MTPDQGLTHPTPLSPTVFHILLAIERAPLHGYGILKAVENSSQGDVRVGPGTIYGSLARMEVWGLVRETEPRADGRRRFELTANGQAALSHEAIRIQRLAQLVRSRRLVPEGGS